MSCPLKSKIKHNNTDTVEIIIHVIMLFHQFKRISQYLAVGLLNVNYSLDDMSVVQSPKSDGCLLYMCDDRFEVEPPE